MIAIPFIWLSVRYLPFSILALLPLLRPARRELVRDTDVIEHARHNGVYDFNNRFGIRVENGIGRKNRRSGEEQQFHVLDVNQTQRRFTRNENQFLLLFQRHISSAEQNILAVTVRNASHRSHRAGDHDHHVGGIRAAGERSIHAFDAVRFHAVTEFQSIGQFRGDDLLRVVADDDVDFVCAGVEVVEQALGIERAAGSGDGNKNFQAD